MWNLRDAKVYHTFVSLSYVRENPVEGWDGLLFLFVEDTKTEIRIVYHDDGVKYAMRLTVDRVIVHSESKDIQNLWNEVYRHGEFE